MFKVKVLTGITGILQTLSVTYKQDTTDHDMYIGK